MAATLYFVSTPIGNLKDMSFRAVETLKSADIIACEDTRRSLVLLNEYGIKKPLLSCHKFNESAAAENIISKLKSGQTVAYISDAGTPCISDPGAVLLRAAKENGVNYTVIPGACAFVSALVLSGFPAERFMFCGFLPQKNAARKEYLQSIKGYTGTLIFYSAPHDINKDIKDIYSVLGERRFAAVKEITKIYERVIYGSLSGGVTEEIRGEYVLICEGAERAENPLCLMSAEEHIKHYTDKGLTVMEAVKQTAKDRKLPKNEVYKHTVKDKIT